MIQFLSVNNVSSATFDAISVQADINELSGAPIVRDLTLNTTGLISSAALAGIRFRLGDVASGPMAAGVKFNVNIGQNSIVQGLEAAISGSSVVNTAFDGNDHPVVVINDGIMRNLSQASDAQVVSGYTTPASKATSSVSFIVNNRNLMVGTVQLGNYDDSVTNTGTWNTAGGTNDMGAGNNVINNQASGTVIAANNPNAAQVTTFNNVTTFNHAGTLTMQDGFAGDSTVVTGTFNGQGGRILLDTFLGTDNSPSDKLVINGGRATGSTSLLISNTTGTGELTTGNGILVVEAINGATTDASAFKLGQRVAAGAYEYMLFYGGNANAGGNANDQNWYLRNTLIPTPTPTPSPTPDVPPVEVPIVRPEVIVATTIPPLAIEYGYAMLGTLHERVGETYINAAPVTEERVVWCKDALKNFKCVVRVPVANANGAGKDETRWARFGWARLIGDRGFHDTNNFMRRGADYDYNFGGIEAGLDIYAREQADGTLDKVGLYVGYGQISSNVKGQFGGKAGSVDMDGYTIAGYWTHHSPNNWYTDAVVQGTWYTNTNAKSIYGMSISPDGFGILGSLEGGYAFKFSNNWTVEPQAQIVYQNVSFDNARDGFGAYRFDDGDSLRGRIGLRLTRTWNRADDGTEPRLITAWLRANIWHEFLGKSQTQVTTLSGLGGATFNSYLAGTWGELGAGVTAQMTDKINIFATGAYNRSLDNKGREGWDGRLGATVKW